MPFQKGHKINIGRKRKKQKKIYYWRKEKIDWSYIAGFFDGEGTFMLTHKSLEIAVGQAQGNVKPIYQISKFLIKEKIYHILDEERELRNPKWQNQTHIRIRRIGPIKRFLEKSIPYLILKRERAIKMYNFLYNKRGHKKETRAKLNEIFSKRS